MKRRPSGITRLGWKDIAYILVISPMTIKCKELRGMAMVLEALHGKIKSICYNVECRRVGNPTVSDLVPWTNIFTTAAGCLPSDPSIISCLRSKPSEVLYQASLVTLNATTGLALVYNRVVDGFFFQEGKRAAEEVRKGNVADVPIITGCNLDEGTLFVPHTFNTADEIVNFFRVCIWLTYTFISGFLVLCLFRCGPPAVGLLYVGNLSVATPEQTKLFKGLLELYPDIPPYEPVKDDRFFGSNNQYKRAASLLGDIVFHSGRRALLDAYIKHFGFYPAWTYLYTQVTPDTPAYQGVYHGSELPAVFGLYARQNTTSDLGKTSLVMISAWVTFGNSLDPNRPFLLPFWPRYGWERNMLRIGNGHFDLIRDDFRKEGIEFLQRKEFTDVFNF
ncbi:Alpha/Beta hydrolase protein [Cantharellus anzutake]|uniref:Alpha/Beta hydrolase protein n=1 Tax=Cantharellus anzutake TaxID=1750568 RepID=UPI001908259F|nr:Alpha/Beta hydrolase protein [Cantharellus anzutake]KAF8331136.1 Alpha/Beta hydrolase protein [Cantharellus anzutake]